jgi:muramidase (phage lysozyme)
MKIIQPIDVSQHQYYELTPERLAILDLIAYTEGTDREIGKTKKGYDILFGGKTFPPGKDHPRIHVPFGKTTSTAAGRYQILDKTWDWLQLGLEANGFKPFPSFAPKYQDQAALYLIDAKRSAIEAVDSGDLNEFLKLCSWEWASLPTPEGKGRYGQPIVKPSKIKEIYSQLVNLWRA